MLKEGREGREEGREGMRERGKVEQLVRVSPVNSGRVFRPVSYSTSTDW